MCQNILEMLYFVLIYHSRYILASMQYYFLTILLLASLQ